MTIKHLAGRHNQQKHGKFAPRTPENTFNELVDFIDTNYCNEFRARTDIMKTGNALGLPLPGSYMQINFATNGGVSNLTLDPSSPSVDDIWPGDKASAAYSKQLDIVLKAAKKFNAATLLLKVNKPFMYKEAVDRNFCVMPDYLNGCVGRHKDTIKSSLLKKFATQDVGPNTKVQSALRAIQKQEDDHKQRIADKPDRIVLSDLNFLETASLIEATKEFNGLSIFRDIE